MGGSPGQEFISNNLIFFYKLTDSAALELLPFKEQFKKRTNLKISYSNKREKFA